MRNLKLLLLTILSCFFYVSINLLQQLPISEILNIKVMVKVAGKTPRQPSRLHWVPRFIDQERRQCPLADWIEHTKRGLLNDNTFNWLLQKSSKLNKPHNYFFLNLCTKNLKELIKTMFSQITFLILIVCIIYFTFK